MMTSPPPSHHFIIHITAVLLMTSMLVFGIKMKPILFKSCTCSLFATARTPILELSDRDFNIHYIQYVCMKCVHYFDQFLHLTFYTHVTIPLLESLTINCLSKFTHICFQKTAKYSNKMIISNVLSMST
jgi:hypothetical protein